MCVYIPPSHSFNSVSLSVLSEGLSWKRLPPTRSLFSFCAPHQIYIHNEQAQCFHMLHVKTHAAAPLARVNACASPVSEGTRGVRLRVGLLSAVKTAQSVHLMTDWALLMRS